MKQLERYFKPLTAPEMRAFRGEDEGRGRGQSGMCRPVPSDFPPFVCYDELRFAGRSQYIEFYGMNSSVHTQTSGGGGCHRGPLLSPGLCPFSRRSHAASPFPLGFKPGESSDPMEKMKGGEVVQRRLPVAAALSRRPAPARRRLSFRVTAVQTSTLPPALGAAAAAQPGRGAGRLAPCALALAPPRLFQALGKSTG